MSAQTVCWLARMDVAGYTITAIAGTERAAKTAVRKEYRAALKRRAIYDVVPAGMSPFEYFGLGAVEITYGKAEWL